MSIRKLLAVACHAYAIVSTGRRVKAGNHAAAMIGLGIAIHSFGRRE